MKPTIRTEFYKCRPVKVLSNGWILLLLSAMIVFCLFMSWVLFPTQIKSILSTPRAERVKIAVLDEETFAKYQRYHGKKAMEVVIYEADGKAYFYNKDGRKVFVK